MRNRKRLLVINMLLCMMVFLSCGQKSVADMYLVSNTPSNKPIVFKPELVPEGMLIHSGRFSPDLSEFYFTLSDKEFKKFDVKVIRKEGTDWSKPEPAAFNSEFNEHGTSFSIDGKTVYFASTRPIPDLPDTWHLWRSSKSKNGWSKPEHIDIPNLRNKLTSHPSVSRDGTLFYHSGNIDYSDLNIYYSEPVDGKYAAAKKLPTTINIVDQQNTPFIAPDKSYILFEASSKIHISYLKPDGSWTNAKSLGSDINKNGKGNPFVTPDGKFLFFVRGENDWSVYWISTNGIINGFN